MKEGYREMFEQLFEDSPDSSDSGGGDGNQGVNRLAVLEIELGELDSGRFDDPGLGELEKDLQEIRSDSERSK